MNNTTAPSTPTFDVLVLGGGPAGVTAALRACELGARVGLVESNRMGGVCTNDGCVPTRVLAKAARLMREAEHLPTYGIQSSPPVLDFERLITRTQQVVYTIQEKKQLVSHLEASGATVYAGVGPARFIDPHTVALVDGRRLSADKIIICVGGHARRLAFQGAEYALTHSDVWSLKQQPRSVVIIGAAATGSQLASIFNAFGSQTTMLELAQRILPAEDEHVSQAMQAALTSRGIQIVTGIQGVERIERGTGGLELVYLHGGEQKTLKSESVIISAGWPGNLEGLNLEAAGVKTERGYVQVNEHLQTTVPHIFAAGDITGRMMLVQSAGHEARVAAENAVLGPAQPYGHYIVPRGGFTDPEYASVGLTEAQARARLGDITLATIPYTDLDRAVIDDRPEGLCKLIVSTADHRLQGAHVVGEGALETVQIIAAGMAADMWVEQLAELELAYPTFCAVVGLAARSIVHQLGVRPVSPQWRALSARYAAEWERREG
ncbi:MAG TPA: NAD(P)/FAD-dependent oxidoreductase [Anaerolineales bacterium]|nr:NAD(P)/FAD-dependent oxidoreductase [Anaerolineales bacterium]